MNTLQAQERLIVVSNRVPPPMNADKAWAAGGLVSALLPALQDTDRALWFGWSGELGSPDGPARRSLADGVSYATIDLSLDQLHGYYEEFANRLLWPMMHGLPERACPEAADSFDDYRAVNRRFATALAELLEPDDVVWVHDYHLICVGEELRRLGWDGRVGYFHHIPIPDRDLWRELPYSRALASGFDAYDLIGVQTHRDAARLRAILDGPAMERVDAYPISIDPCRFRAAAEEAPDDCIGPDGEKRRLFLGVDRLDYTKAIPQRLEAFERALRGSAQLRTGARFVQWCAPSRTSIPEYQAEREAVEAAACRIQSCYGDRVLSVAFDSQPPSVVARALYRADICVVTSIADGMNLVAKEFAAVHSEEHPGVLILSDSAGAAEELREAVIFPAGDQNGMAQAMERAFEMPEGERRERARRLRAHVDRHTGADWMTAFLDDLAAQRLAARAFEPVAGGAASHARPRRPVSHWTRTGA